MRQTLEAFGGPDRGLWLAQFELVSLSQRNEDLRAFLAGIQEFAASGLAELFLGLDPEKEPETARAAGAVLHSFFIGLIAKYFLDPEHMPSAQEFAAGMRIVAQRLTLPASD